MQSTQKTVCCSTSKAGFHNFHCAGHYLLSFKHCISLQLIIIVANAAIAVHSIFVSKFCNYQCTTKTVTSAQQFTARLFMCVDSGGGIVAVTDITLTVQSSIIIMTSAVIS